MKTNAYQNLTNEQLIKRKSLLKGAIIGLGIIFIIIIALVIYLFATRGPKNIPISTLIPIFTMPITFLPLAIIFGQLNKEIKTRNL